MNITDSIDNDNSIRHYPFYWVYLLNATLDITILGHYAMPCYWLSIEQIRHFYYHRAACRRPRRARNRAASSAALRAATRNRHRDFGGKNSGFVPVAPASLVYTWHILYISFRAHCLHFESYYAQGRREICHGRKQAP